MLQFSLSAQWTHFPPRKIVQDQNQTPKAAVRWTLVGKHDGNGYFGAPTGANIYILGINHVEFGPRGIKNEWVLFDETMIWKQILMQTG